jgi:DNA-binding CsgD family transcriptional regulator
VSGRSLSLDQAGFLRLVEAIYDAAADPAHWDLALERLAAAFEGPSVLFVQDVRSASVNVYSSARFDTAAQAEYFVHYNRINPWVAQASLLPPGSFTIAQRMVPQRDLVRSEFYAGWLRPQGVRDSLGYLPDNRDGVLSGISVMRDEGRGLYDDAAIELWRALMPHAHRALDIHRRLILTDLSREAGLAGSAALAIGVLAADERARVLYLDAVAETMLAAGDGLALRAGRLVALDGDAQGRLDRLLAGAARTAHGRAAHPGGMLCVPRRGRPPLHLLVAPLSPHTSAFGLFTPAAIVFLHDPSLRPVTPEVALREVWHLTPAEARLVRAIVGGQRLEDYAAGAGIALATAKTQLRRAFDKTDTRRQTELVRAVAENPIMRLAELIRP